MGFVPHENFEGKVSTSGISLKKLLEELLGRCFSTQESSKT
jgi:hypothetical protein